MVPQQGVNLVPVACLLSTCFCHGLLKRMMNAFVCKILAIGLVDPGSCPTRCVWPQSSRAAVECSRRCTLFSHQRALPDSHESLKPLRACLSRGTSLRSDQLYTALISQVLTCVFFRLPDLHCSRVYELNFAERLAFVSYNKHA
jgi:hypothetical protein